MAQFAADTERRLGSIQQGGGINAARRHGRTGAAGTARMCLCRRARRVRSSEASRPRRPKQRGGAPMRVGGATEAAQRCGRCGGDGTGAARQTTASGPVEACCLPQQGDKNATRCRAEAVLRRDLWLSVCAALAAAERGPGGGARCSAAAQAMRGCCCRSMQCDGGRRGRT